MSRTESKMILVLAVILAVAAAMPQTAGAAVQLGARAGYYHSTGDVFQGSGDIGGNGLWGLAASVGILPPIDVEFAYERYTKNLDSDRIPVGANARFRDNAYLLTGKFRVPVLGAISPFWLHLGAGAGLHHVETSGNVSQFPDQIINQTKNRGEWHAVVGADLKLTSVLVYGEYRFQDMTQKDGPRFNSIYAGLNIYLE